jgi:hypothetical protein
MAIKRVDSTYRGKPTHRYEIDGVKADGVTTLIGDGLPKPALLPWGIKAVATYAATHLDRLVDMQPMGTEAIIAALKQAPYTDRDTAAKRGTEVHNLAEKMSHGQEVEVPDDLAGHVASAVRFLDDWQPKVIHTELTVASRKWNYAGTFDLLADIDGYGRCLIDYKTSRSGIYGETALQLAAYAHAEVWLDADGQEQPMADLGIERGLAVWIRPDGYDVIEADITEATYRTFLHVAYVARKGKVMKDLLSAPLTIPAFGGAA